MRLLLVDSSTTALETCAMKIGDLDSSVLSALEIDIRIATEKDFLEKLPNADLLIFGPEMEARSAARAREAKELAPEIPILVFLTDGTYRRGEFKAEKDGDVRKVFPLNAPPAEIEHELFNIHDETVSAGEAEEPESSKPRNRIVKFTPEITQQIKSRLKSDIDSNSVFQSSFLIASRYEVIKLLGAGTMGLVYLCKHKELGGHFVAVKVLFAEFATDAIATARFRNEIHASFCVSHPNVVSVYEYLKDGDLIAYTMEYAGGGNLNERLNKAEPLPLPSILRILSEICDGLQAIHDAGVVHRDLKPENILFSHSGTAKISDLGIARMGLGPKLSDKGGVVGTIDYVSPEYMLTSEVDSRSDIYAVGVIAYEIITGQNPFKGEGVYATMTKRIKVDPEPPSALRKDCSPQLDSIVLKAMNRDPEQRYQTAAEMSNDLKKLL